MEKEMIFKLLDDAVYCAEVELVTIGRKTDLMTEVMNNFCDFYGEATGATDVECQKMWESKVVQDLLQKALEQR